MSRKKTSQNMVVLGYSVMRGLVPAIALCSGEEEGGKK